MAISQSQLILAFLVTLVIFVAAIGIADIIQKRGKIKFAPEEIRKFILIRIIFDSKSEHCSLSLFQFMAWTLVIAFVYSMIFVLRLLNGNPQPPMDISAPLLILMGISVVVPFAGYGLTQYRVLTKKAEGWSYEPPTYSSMVSETNNPSLTRFQMFLWTIIAIIFFCWTFYLNLTDPAATLMGLTLPTIPSMLLSLMGISQAGYLAGKYQEGTFTAPQTTQSSGGTANQKSTISIQGIIPSESRAGDTVSIIGSGFGNEKSTILIRDKKIPVESITSWQEGKIDFIIPDWVDLGENTVQVVVSGGATTTRFKVISYKEEGGWQVINPEIIGGIWIDNPQGGLPPIGHLIPNKAYHFFYEFLVPEGTPVNGRVKFRTRFFVNNQEKGMQLNDSQCFDQRQNYNEFRYVFTEEGKYNLEIRGKNPKSLEIEVKRKS